MEFVGMYFLSSLCLSVCRKNFNFCHNLGTLKSRDFTFGMHSYSTNEIDSLKRKVNDFVTLTTLWPWPLYKCIKIAIWNFVAAGAFVFHLGFFRYLTLGPGSFTFLFSMELSICQFGIPYFSVWLTREEGEFIQMPIKMLSGWWTNHNMMDHMVYWLSDEL